MLELNLHFEIIIVVSSNESTYTDIFTVDNVHCTHVHNISRAYSACV